MSKLGHVSITKILPGGIGPGDIAVYVDGVSVSNVREANDIEGWYERYATDLAGDLRAVDGHLVTERIYANIEFRYIGLWGSFENHRKVSKSQI